MIKNVEFHMPGGCNGVLLIHGLTGTPTEMRFIGKGLNRNGFTVYGMQLAGHCGDEADLLATGRSDWYRSVVAAAEKLRGEVDQLSFFLDPDDLHECKRIVEILSTALDAQRHQLHREHIFRVWREHAQTWLRLVRI